MFMMKTDDASTYTNGILSTAEVDIRWIKKKKKNYIRALAIVAGLAILYLSGFYLFLFFITSM